MKGEIITHKAKINSSDIKARHFHDLFIMAVIASGGTLKITREVWLEATKYDAIERKTAPDGSYLFTVKKKGK